MKSTAPVHRAALAALLLGFTGAAALAADKADSFEPEQVTMESAIDPGANVLVNQASWDGASRIHVFNQDDLKYQGVLSMGLTSQFEISPDGSRVYTLSDYMERYTYGPVHSVVQIFDLETLTPVAEIEVPNKAVKAIGMNQLIEVSADGKRLYVQNATPGTSVTVVDLDSREVVSEVPTPGCYGIVPAASGHRFTTLCGGGTLQTFDVSGKEYAHTTSDKIFDVDEDALYVDAVRTKSDKLVFTSFNGNLYIVDDSGDTPVLERKLKVAEGLDGDWAPGGYGVTTYNAATDTVFMIMHDEAYEGSHKDGSDEIWAYSLADEAIVSRSAAPDLIAISVTQGETPVIYGSNEMDETVDVYRAEGDGFDFEKTASDDHVGWTTSLSVVASP